ncbi:hypothetical protein VPH35_041186 [Triticum aestivum]
MGGRSSCCSEAMVCRCCGHGDFFAPSGSSPEVQSGRWLIGTRSRFVLSVWGPPCKSQGLVCYVFYFGVLVGALYFHHFGVKRKLGVVLDPSSVKKKDGAAHTSSPSS